MKTDVELLAERLKATVKDVLSAKRKAVGLPEASDELVERVCDEVMVAFQKNIGTDTKRFSPEEIDSFRRKFRVRGNFGVRHE